MINRQNPSIVPGGVLNLFRFARDPLQQIQWIKDTAGDAGVIHILHNRVYFFSCAEAVYEVLVKNAKDFDKWQVQKKQLKLLGEFALPNTDGDIWRRHRKIMQPAFHTKRIQAYADDIIQQTQTLLSTWHDGTTRSISEDMKLLTLRIVGRAILGIGISNEDVQIVGQAMETVQKTIIQRASLPFKVPEWFPTSTNRRFVAAFKHIIDTVQQLVQQKQTSNKDSGDLLSAMILLREHDEQPLTAQELLDEAIALYIGGHETTASILTWAWYELSQNPDAAAKFYAEVDSLGGKEPTIEDLAKMPYVDAIMRETLRRYPPLYFMARTPNQPTSIIGYDIPQKNTSVMLNIYTIHHDERYYDNPFQFNPDRWLPDMNNETLDKKLPRGAYVPFGDGPRVCIGNHFAMLEMRLILISIAQQYRLELRAEPKVEILAGGTLSPRNGLMMRVWLRGV